jgi:hypothetical protein
MQPVFKEPIPDHAMLLDLLLDYAQDETTISRILVDNPADLYDFPQVNNPNRVSVRKRGLIA